MKKILVSIGLVAGMLLAASPVLAATYAPATNSKIPGVMQGTPATGVAVQPVTTFSRAVAPCPIMQQNGGYGQMSLGNCGNMMYLNKPGLNHNLQGWLGLMFVLTVMMVWAVLLLLILFLWKMLKKHKHS